MNNLFFSLETIPVRIGKLLTVKIWMGKKEDITAPQLQSYKGNVRNILFQLTLCVYLLKLYSHWNPGLPFARWVAQLSVFLCSPSDSKSPKMLVLQRLILVARANSL